MTTYIILFLLAIGFTILLDKLVKTALFIPPLAAFCTAALFQLFAFLQLGFLDPFFLIAILVSFVFAIFVSIFTLVIIRKLRIKKFEK